MTEFTEAERRELARWVAVRRSGADVRFPLENGRPPRFRRTRFGTKLISEGYVVQTGWYLSGNACFTLSSKGWRAARAISREMRTA